jgi:nucleoside-diphosphate-sugar epimerase
MLLITGATGHSGQLFVQKLISKKYDKKIRCTVRKTSNRNYLNQSGLDIDYMTGDLKDSNFVDRALDEVSIVINFTGLKCVKNIVASEKTENLKWVISVHTTAIFSKFKTLSSEYKDIENCLIQSNSRFTILRPTMIFGGEKDRNISKLINYFERFRFFPVFGKGENLLQPIYANDVAIAVYAVLQNYDAVIDKSYNIAGKYPISYNRLLKIVAKEMNKDIMLVHIPYGISYLLVKFLNSIFKKAPISTEQVMRMNENKAYDYSEAKIDFGFSPISFEEGIALQIKSYKKNTK